MNSNNHMKHGGCACGCGGHGACSQLGPFLALDHNCIGPPKENPTSTGSIIPFSSGITSVALATVLNGLVGIPSFIGFGTAVPGLVVLGNTIDLSAILTEAFTVPRAGNITAISASFTALTAVTITGAATVRAQIYKAPAGSTLFTATNAAVDLVPAFTGLLVVGQTSFASANVAPIPVAQGERLLMVYSVSGTGISLAQTVTGTASAGINIE
ncbi:exosporium glycoprotein BclB-related protein [Solibacillus sp. R5-41]|uniref:exosporium glycoprotein BclB-related protein n=1 Tax=Solibacillus sp. R5-41 TaxID=2048654 RepID=UPI0020A53312|nr:exosporium glycoprotein BclB-related protein [Solibacillus sp. R5-41]